MKRKLLGLAVLLAVVGSQGVVAADTTGVEAGKILVGQSAAFDGPAQALGLGMRLGLEAAFKEVNDAGGIHGRQIELITMDDGYEPTRAIVNTETLIDHDKVFALIGAVGTPTSKAAQPIAKRAGVPFVGPFTGAGFLRDPVNTHVVNVRGTYDQETEAWIAHLTDDLHARRIAILYQDDSFGRAGLSGVQKAMAKRGLELVSEGTYMRNSVAVRRALLTIRKGDPDAVVMVGSYKPIAAFVTLARKLKLEATYVTISFVGSKALAAELGKDGDGVVVTQVVPFHSDSTLPLVADYQHALKAFDADAETGFVSLEGYLTGRVFLEGLKRAGPNLSREALVNVFQQPLELDFGGAVLNYGPGDNQGMERVYLSVLQADGSFRYVDKLGSGINTAELPD